MYILFLIWTHLGLRMFVFESSKQPLVMYYYLAMFKALCLMQRMGFKLTWAYCTNQMVSFLPNRRLFLYSDNTQPLVIFLCVHQYKFHEVAIEEFEKIHRVYPDMELKTDTYSKYL